MKEAEDFRAAARAALKGRWPEAILAGLIYSLLAGSSYQGATLNISLNGGDSFLSSSAAALIAGVILVSFLVFLIIGGAIQLGYALFNLNLIDGKPAQVSQLFSQFHRIGTGICMQLLLSIFILLWSLLLIIPGIIASYSYAMTPYILAEHPEYGALEAIRRSKEMMRGNKMRLFILNLSFIGWVILGALTCGLGMLAVTPYMQAATADFYREISAGN
ncbi:MAG: DUF975 family protein [Candidatus Merdivicinus sp.]|jgi:uncharacterized membrane protein